MKTQILPEVLQKAVRAKMQDYYPDGLTDVFANDFSEFVVHESAYVILLRDAVLTADLQTGEVRIAIDLHDHMGQFFEIYRYKDDYILYGELEIIRLSASFEILWLFSARDIFVDPDGASAFSMDADGIHLLDWLGWYYHISYNGKLINEYYHNTCNHRNTSER